MHEEVIDEEDESQHQQAAGFLQVDGAAPLEDINLAKTPEIAETDQFAGLYWMDSDTDDGYMDNRSDADVEPPEEPEGLGESRLGGLHGDGFLRQPPSIPNAQCALENLTSLLLL